MKGRGEGGRNSKGGARDSLKKEKGRGNRGEGDGIGEGTWSPLAWITR